MNSSSDVFWGPAECVDCGDRLKASDAGGSSAVIPFERLWTPKDVASFLQVSRSWVYAKAEAGLLPALRVGGLLRFDPTRVRAWIVAQSAGVLPLPSRARDDLLS